MDTRRVFRALVLGGASLALSTAGCGSGDKSPADAGITDAGTCSCSADPTWPGQDCAPAGQTKVCCWLHATAPCCP